MRIIFPAENDFSGIDLLRAERIRLFVMRFKRRVTEAFLGEYLRALYELDFIAPNHTDKVDGFGHPISDGTYSLTSKYARYRIHKRREFLYSNMLAGILSSIISAIISLAISYWIISK